MSKLELFFPVKPCVITQGFGENKACIEINPGIAIEKRRVIGCESGICPIGYEPLYAALGMTKGHTGLDMQTFSEMVYAAHDGVVTEMQTEAARGLGVGVTSEEEFDLGGYGIHQVKTRYWHFKSILVKPGQKVVAGDILGISDSTGFSSGDHVHFELCPVSKNTSGEYYNTFQNNGFFGKIDPSPYWNGYFARDAQTILSILNQQISALKKIIELYRLMVK